MRLDAAGLIYIGRVDAGPVRGQFAAHEAGAADVPDAVDGLIAGEAMRQLHHRTFGVAVDQQIRLRVQQH